MAKMEPMAINVETDRPIRAASHPRPPREEKVMHEEVDKMQASGAISPSRSPWNAPIVIVPKKDGSLRFCVDFRRLNDVTKRETYPMPRIDTVLDQLGDAQ